MTLLPLDEREAAEDARQALVEEQRMRRNQLEHNKKALGMLASRFAGAGYVALCFLRTSPLWRHA